MYRARNWSKSEGPTIEKIIYPCPHVKCESLRKSREVDDQTHGPVWFVYGHDTVYLHFPGLSCRRRVEDLEERPPAWISPGTVHSE